VEEPIQPHFMMSEVTLFSRIEDPENHLKAFRTQMFISGGSDSVCSKMFVGTFIEMALQWFSGLSNRSITSFRKFSRMFEEQILVNKVKPPWMVDFFDIKQQDGEPLKKYLNRFCKVSIRVQHLNEEMVVDSFVKCL